MVRSTRAKIANVLPRYQALPASDVSAFGAGFGGAKRVGTKVSEKPMACAAADAHRGSTSLQGIFFGCNGLPGCSALIFLERPDDRNTRKGPGSLETRRDATWRRIRCSRLFQLRFPPPGAKGTILEYMVAGHYCRGAGFSAFTGIGTAPASFTGCSDGADRCKDGCTCHARATCIASADTGGRHRDSGRSCPGAGKAIRKRRPH